MQSKQLVGGRWRSLKLVPGSRFRLLNDARLNAEAVVSAVVLMLLVIGVRVLACLTCEHAQSTQRPHTKTRILHVITHILIF